ncbi:hypothetical protein [Streptomyces sp. HNM0574]|uniref:hypothetical protein n=1 Tax=Streptomyces sp. HNM0574 TaxID=2714954 RepID=UPI00146AC268|nr:hypothetical protein [Streptomyces sp. HNM0574]NLU66677.1 hypothetical protein [Streptomyces sp. HNM0574]
MSPVEDLLADSCVDLSRTADLSEDPRTVEDVLQEVQLVDTRVHSFSGTAGLLFDLRTALQFDDGEAGLLVVHGLRELHIWSAEPEESRVWTVMSSSPRTSPDEFAMELGLNSRIALRVAGARARFFTLRIPGISVAPPDSSGGERPGAAKDLVAWSSPCSVLQYFSG